MTKAKDIKKIVDEMGYYSNQYFNGQEITITKTNNDYNVAVGDIIAGTFCGSSLNYEDWAEVEYLYFRKELIG